MAVISFTGYLTLLICALILGYMTHRENKALKES